MALLIILLCCLSCITGELLTREACRKDSNEAANLLEGVGKECLEGLYESNKINTFTLSQCMKFDASAFESVNFLFFSTNSASGFQSAVIKKNPEICKHITDDMLKLRVAKDVVFTEKCFENMKPSLYDSMSLVDFYSFVERTPAAYPLLRQKLVPLANDLLGLYKNYLLNGTTRGTFTSDRLNKIAGILANMRVHFAQLQQDNQTIFTSACQIIGDHLIEDKMIYAFNDQVKLEGNSFAALYPIVRKQLNLFRSEHPHFKASTIDMLMKKIVIGEFFGHLYLASTDKVDISIVSLFFELVVADMVPGESIMIPHGYKSTPGHATVSEFIKKADGSILLNYYNTGEGLNYHASITNRNNPLEKKYSHKMSFSIPTKELNMQFWNRFIRLFTTTKNDHEQWQIQDIYNGLLGLFPPEYIVKDFGPSDIFITGQQSGTCTFKSLQTWMRTKFDQNDDYQFFKLSIKYFALKDLYENYKAILRERKALEVLIHLAEEIEREAEIVYSTTPFYDEAKKIGEYVNHIKTSDLARLLKLMRENPLSNQYNTLKLNNSRYAGINLRVFYFLKRAEEWLSFGEAFATATFSSKGIARDIPALQRLVQMHSSRVLYSFLLELAMSWNIEGEVLDASVDKLKLIKDMEVLFSTILKAKMDYSNDEFTLFLRLLGIQMWNVFVSIDFVDFKDDLLTFRPLLADIRMHGTSQLSYFEAMKRTVAWSKSKRQFNLYDSFKLDGNQSNPPSEALNLAKLFYEAPSSNPPLCNSMDDELKKKKYHGPPLVFTRCVFDYFKSSALNNSNMEQQYLLALCSVINTMRFLQENHISKSLYFTLKKEGDVVKLARGGLDSSFSRLGGHEEIKIAKSDSINGIMDVLSTPKTAQEFGVKILKQIKVLQCLGNEMKQFMMIVFLARRPALFHHLSTVNLFFLTVAMDDNGTPAWDLNSNLIEAWRITITSIIKYHVVLHAGTLSLHSLVAIQNTILFALNLSHYSSSNMAVHAEFIAHLQDYMEAYSNYYALCPNKKSLIHPNFFFVFSSFLKKDFTEFAARYLAADAQLIDSDCFTRKIDLMRILQDVIGIGFQSMHVTIDKVRVAAKRASELSGGICADAGDFHELQGEFPLYQVAHKCFINFADGTFLSRRTASSFRKDYVQGLEYFCPFELFTDLKKDLRCTLHGVDYEFIKTGINKYRLSMREGGENYVLMDDLENNFDASLSKQLYSLWCSASKCILKRFDRQTAQTETLLDVQEIFPSLVVNNERSYMALQDNFLQEFFPSDLLLGFLNSNNIYEYFVLHYVNSEGNQLKFKVESNVLSLECEKKIYSTSLNDLSSRAVKIYRLDIISLLVLHNEENEWFALVPKIPDYLISWYSQKAIWISGKMAGKSEREEFSSRADHFNATFLIAVDANGFLHPSGTLQVAVVAFWYFMAGEYELAMHFLRSINHTRRFTGDEMDQLELISYYSDLFAGANHVRFYAKWLLFMNAELFERTSNYEMAPLNAALRSLSSLASACFISDSYVPKSLTMFYSDANPHESILSKYETEMVFSTVLPSRDSYYCIYGNVITSGTVDKVHIHDLDDFARYVKFLEVPEIDEKSSNHIKNILKSNSYSDAMLCGAFRYMSGKMSFEMQRIIHERCCSGVAKLPAYSPLHEAFYYEFNFDNAVVVFYKKPAIPADKLRTLDLSWPSMAEFENEMQQKLLTRQFVAILAEFKKGIAKAESKSKLTASSQTDYVIKNISLGEMDLEKTQLRREFLVQFIVNDVQFIMNDAGLLDSLNAAAEHLKGELSAIKENLFNFSIGFNGKAISFIDFDDDSMYLNQQLLKFIRHTPIYFFERYFTSPDAKEIQENILSFFYVTLELQRINRIIKHIHDASAAISKEAYLMEKADELCIEFSGRPVGTPFRMEIILFEVASGIRLRNANMEAIEELMGQPVNSVLQRVMGGGKTLVIGTLCISFARAKKFNMFIPPIALLETNAGNTLSTNQKCFGQRGHVIFISRCYQHQNSYDHCISFFQTLRTMIMSCIDRNEYLMLSRESLLSLYNTYKEALIRKIDNVAEETQKIIQLMKAHAFAIIDEVDSVFFPYFELNYPITEDSMMSIDLARCILASFKVLAEDDEIKAIHDVTLRHDSSISSENYNKLTQLLLVKIKENEHYVNCQADNGASEASCAKQFSRFLNSTFFDCLAGRLNVSYGAMHEIQDKAALNERVAVLHARPYEGSNRPSKLSEFADVVTSLTYTILMYLKRDLSDAQKVFFFQDMVRFAESDFLASIANVLKNTAASDGSVMGLDQTPTGRLLSLYCQTPNIISRYLFTPENEKITFLQDNCFSTCINQYGIIFTYIEKQVLPTITKTDEQVSSNAQDLFYLFSQYVAYSGTINNHNIFNEGDKIKPDDVALGTIMSQVVTKATKVLTIKSRSSLTEIMEVVEHYDAYILGRVRTFIDVAAFFNESQNKDLVDEALKALNLQGGLYFKTGTDNLFFSNAGGKEVPVLKTYAAFLRDTCKLDAHERFTFYDEVHTRGVDIVQGDNSVALVTVRSGTGLSNLLQGILRMRKFFGGQEIIFLVTEEDEQSIKDELGIQVDLSGLDILRAAYESQEKSALSENQMIFMQKISAYLNNEIISTAADAFYSKLSITYLFELEMITLPFSGKLTRYLEEMASFIQFSLSSHRWIDDIKAKWENKLTNPSHAIVMTRNTQREAQKQQETQRQLQLENQMENVDLSTSFRVSAACKNLLWKKGFLDKINHSKVNDIKRIEPELISWKAINLSENMKNNGGKCPENVYFTSNFVQVQSGAHSAHVSISFKVDSRAGVHARRDQFGYFIAIMRNTLTEEDYSYYYMEPIEASYWLEKWRKEDLSSGLIMLVNSNGDILYPSYPSTANLIEIREKSQMFNWNATKIVNTLSTTAYQLGMLEFFSNFGLSKDLAAAEKANAKKVFTCADLRGKDMEVDKVSILGDVFLAEVQSNRQMENWCDHLWHPSFTHDDVYGTSTVTPVAIADTTTSTGGTSTGGTSTVVTPTGGTSTGVTPTGDTSTVVTPSVVTPTGVTPDGDTLVSTLGDIKTPVAREAPPTEDSSTNYSGNVVVNVNHAIRPSGTDEEKISPEDSPEKPEKDKSKPEIDSTPQTKPSSGKKPSSDKEPSSDKKPNGSNGSKFIPSVILILSILSFHL